MYSTCCGSRRAQRRGLPRASTPVLREIDREPGQFVKQQPLACSTPYVDASPAASGRLRTVFPEERSMSAIPLRSRLSRC